MTRIRVERDVQIPDDLRVRRALSAPHIGPRILFFSGGTALNGISRRLKNYTFNSMHLITPFDSGGSSQELRKVFDMPAVGDLRSRLMALADESDLGQPDIYALFSHRFSKHGDQDALKAEIQAMAVGKHPLVTSISEPMRQLIQTFLQKFLHKVPKDFDYRNASIGNLIIAGGYLDYDRALEPVLFLMSKMVDVRGTVRAVLDANLQLGVELEDGRTIFGQRQISGKEVPPIDRRIVRAFICDKDQELPRAAAAIPERNRQLIRQADVICYPPGSLYSSVIANLLPAGVGREIAATHVPKPYLPSLGHDPEAFGLSLDDQVAAILSAMQSDLERDVPATRLMSHVLCDTSIAPEEMEKVTERHGIPCIRTPLARADAPYKYDPDLVCKVLITIV